MELTARQLQIIEIVKKHAPITSEQIADHLSLSRPTIRADLSLLVMLDYVNAKPKVGYYLGGKTLADTSASQLLHQVKVKDIQGPPIIIREVTTIQDAVVTLFLQDVGTLIICDEEGNLTGVASRKDFLKVTLGNPAAASMPVSLAMTRHPQIVTVSPEDPVYEAAQKIIHHKVDSVPVVTTTTTHEGTEGLRVVGRLSKTSIIKMLLGSEVNGL